MKIALAGSTGFIGRELKRALDGSPHEVVELAAVRVAGLDHGRGAEEAVDDWFTGSPDRSAAAVRLLEGCDVLINAAGSATPGSADLADLFDANVVLPGVLARLAGRAGVRRFVHVSSAAVQGRRDPLDETEVVAPTTPYARSKASAERLLRNLDPAPPELVIYRPTSVQGAGRSMTRSLVRLASRPAVPIVGDGSRPVPLALVDNVAQGIIVSAVAPSVTGVVLQPWEGLTHSLMWELLGQNPKLVRIPKPVAAASIALAALAGRLQPRAQALSRRMELLAWGQGQEAEVLGSLGFKAALGHDAYRDLANEIRNSRDVLPGT